MKVCNYVLIFAAAIWFLPGTAAAAEIPSGPQLQLEELSFDFGQVDEGTVLEHAFKVFNRGNQTLVIENVSPS